MKIDGKTMKVEFVRNDEKYIYIRWSHQINQKPTNKKNVRQNGFVDEH